MVDKYVEIMCVDDRATYIESQNINNLVKTQDGIIKTIETDAKIPIQPTVNDKESLKTFVKKFDVAMTNIIKQDAGVNIHSFGEFLATQSFEMITEQAEFTLPSQPITITNVPMFDGADDIDGYYDIPVYSRKSGYSTSGDKRRFESKHPFEVQLIFTGVLGLGEFYIVETTKGDRYTATQSLTIQSSTENIRSTDYGLVMGSNTININPVYAYLVQNDLVNNSNVVTAGTVIRKIDINFIEIKRIYVGRSKTTFPLTTSNDIDMGKIFRPSTLSLSTKSDITDCVIKIKGMILDELSTIEADKALTTIEITFNTPQSRINQLSILARKK